MVNEIESSPTELSDMMFETISLPMPELDGPLKLDEHTGMLLLDRNDQGNSAGKKTVEIGNFHLLTS